MRAPRQNMGFDGQGKVKNGSGLTICLTGGEKKKSKRFQRVGHELFRMRSTGIIDGVFKSVGRVRWKNLGKDGVNHARELLAEEFKQEAKVDWKRSRTISLRKLIARLVGKSCGTCEAGILIWCKIALQFADRRRRKFSGFRFILTHALSFKNCETKAGLKMALRFFSPAIHESPYCLLSSVELAGI